MHAREWIIHLKEYRAVLHMRRSCLFAYSAEYSWACWSFVCEMNYSLCLYDAWHADNTCFVIKRARRNATKRTHLMLTNKSSCSICFSATCWMFFGGTLEQWLGLIKLFLCTRHMARTLCLSVVCSWRGPALQLRHYQTDLKMLTKKTLKAWGWQLAWL